MTWMVGVDEAGYGPNLGPLVVAATCWQVDEPEQWLPRLAPTRRPKGAGAVAALQRQPARLANLHKALRKIVCTTPDGRRLAIADSKALYKPGTGVGLLEQGVLSTLGCCQLANTLAPPHNWRSLLDCLSADPDDHHAALPWHLDFDCSLPLENEPLRLSRLGKRLHSACHASAVLPVGIWARLVYPAQFNELVAHHGNKAAALSHVTLTLVREVVDRIHSHGTASAPRPTFILCDKHGGRNRYGGLLQHHFHEAWVATQVEGPLESCYHWQSGLAEIQFSFRMGGEEFLPTALASMTAKYLRELAMLAFNRFWRNHLPDLRPTAGYPGDSRRFKADIAPLQQKLAIADHLLWRSR